MKFLLYRVENSVGKGENAGYQDFLVFPTMFSKGFVIRVVNKSLPNDTAFADDKFKGSQMMELLVENIVGKGENTNTYCQYFLGFSVYLKYFVFGDVFFSLFPCNFRC